MIDYVEQLAEFQASAELYIAKKSFALLEDIGEVSSTTLNNLFHVIELVDSLELQEDVDKEKIIAYLVNKYCILPSSTIPFDNLSDSIVVGSTVNVLLPHRHDVIEINNFDEEVTTIVNNILSTFNSDAVLERDIPVIGVTVGGVSDGDLLTQGTTLTELTERIFTKELFHTYVQPTVSLGLAGTPTLVEAGTNISAILQPSFTRNDAGILGEVVYKKNNVEIATNSNLNTYTDSVQITDETLSYTATISYEAGTIVNSNLGNPSPGSILAGSKVTNSVGVTGTRMGFAGYSLPATTSDQIRSLQQSILGATNGTTFDIFIPMGSTSVSFAYREDAGPVSSVKYVEAAMTEVKGIFTETSVEVAGANGYTPISNRVFTFNFPNPTEQDITYRVTI